MEIMEKKKNFKVAFFLGLFMLFCSTCFSQALYIYGGDNHDVFLGCFNCTRYEGTSIWNKYGTNGYKYNSECIWNKYGSYGGQYSNNSPFNRYATKPPVLVDADGNSYGYFTANRYLADRTTDKLALYIVDNWEAIGEDVSEAYDTIFR